ncbi:hypothetical protein ACKLNO_02945 [Neisseriaceae bacterium B1]
MNKFDSNSSPMVFTLTEDEPEMAKSDDWERDLQALRHNRQFKPFSTIAHFVDDEETIEIDMGSEQARAVGAMEMQFDDLDMDFGAANYEQAEQPKRYRMPVADNMPPKSFNDEELDEAYRVYLQQRALEHNARLQDSVLDEDVGVLMQEDWLQAQSALKTEIARNRATQVQTLILHPESMQSETVETDEAEYSRLPEFAVNVYALPDMPATRRVKILSEQELINSLRDKLTPHLTNAVAGMVRQILQKKLATLSYELQIQLNEETPQIVQEVLEYNLDSALRTVKHQLREE